MSELRQKILESLLRRDFARLFKELLLWNTPKSNTPIQVNYSEGSFRAEPIAAIEPLVVLQVSNVSGRTPSMQMRKLCCNKIKKVYHCHLVIFNFEKRPVIVLSRASADGVAEIKIDALQPSEEDLALLESLRVDLDHPPNFSEVTALIEKVLPTDQIKLEVEDVNAFSLGEAFETLFESIRETEHKIREKMPDLSVEEMLKVIEAIKALETFKNKASTLKAEWESLLINFPILKVLKSTVPQKNLSKRIRQTSRTEKEGRLPAGLRTHERAYFIPILQSIADLGGTAKVGQILDRVHEKMKSSFKDYDYESVPSNPNEPRWRTTAKFVRLDLKNAGLLKSDSPKGVWEITDEGIDYLKRHESNQNGG